MTDVRALLPAIDAAAKEAGEAILDIYRTDFDIEWKSDMSPVTKADVDAETVILDVLRSLTPDIPVIAEEEASAGRMPKVGDRFWLVDPLDGTREFLNRNDEFTVNIALIKERRPVLGVVHAPAKDLTFAGAGAGTATRQEGEAPAQSVSVRTPPSEGLTIVASRRHDTGKEREVFLRDYPVANRISCGSSLKFCLVACGEADIYPRFGPTMEWDTAAGHAVLDAAGGCVTTTTGDSFNYRKPDFENPGFLAWGGLRPD